MVNANKKSPFMLSKNGDFLHGQFMNKQKFMIPQQQKSLSDSLYLSSYDLEQKIHSPHTEKQWDYIHEYQC